MTLHFFELFATFKYMLQLLNILVLTKINVNPFGQLRFVILIVIFYSFFLIKVSYQFRKHNIKKILVLKYFMTLGHVYKNCPKQKLFIYIKTNPDVTNYISKSTIASK